MIGNENRKREQRSRSENNIPFSRNTIIEELSLSSQKIKSVTLILEWYTWDIIVFIII